MTTLTKTEIAVRVEYWATQVAHLQRRAYLGNYKMEEFTQDITRINRGLHQLLGDIDKEIYGHDQTEAGDHGTGSGSQDRQYHPVVSELASD